MKKDDLEQQENNNIITVTLKPWKTSLRSLHNFKPRPQIAVNKRSLRYDLLLS